MKYSKVLFLLIVICVFTATASAQFKSYSQLISFNGSWASMAAKETGSTFDGWAFDFTYEQVNMDGDLAGGVSITYLTAQDEVENEAWHTNYQSIPILLQGKYFFGSPNWKFYLMGGIGVQFSRIEHAGPNLLLADGDSGFAFGLGAGVNIFTSEKFFINAAYNFNHLSNSFYQDGLVHLLKIGIGFQYD